jgi:hypothetical protein
MSWQCGRANTRCWRWSLCRLETWVESSSARLKWSAEEAQAYARAPRCFTLTCVACAVHLHCLAVRASVTVFVNAPHRRFFYLVKLFLQVDGAGTTAACACVHQTSVVCGGCRGEAVRCAAVVVAGLALVTATSPAALSARQMCLPASRRCRSAHFSSSKCTHQPNWRRACAAVPTPRACRAVPPSALVAAHPRWRSSCLRVSPLSVAAGGQSSLARRRAARRP